MKFSWDPRKDAANITKHGVSFDEAKTVFGDPLAVTEPDEEHSEDEFRYRTTGESALGRLLVVSHTEPDEDDVRIINAQKADAADRQNYESN